MPVCDIATVMMEDYLLAHRSLDNASVVTSVNDGDAAA